MRRDALHSHADIHTTRAAIVQLPRSKQLTYYSTSNKAILH